MVTTYAMPSGVHARECVAELRKAIRLADEGRSNKDIARVLGLSPGRVRNHLSEAAAKLGASRRIEAARTARDKGWL